MSNDSSPNPLDEWNRLARQNAETALVSSMFEAGSKTSEPIEKFSTWLLVGAAAVASVLLTNSDKILPLLGKTGFVTCGVFLCLSCFFGLLSRLFALQVTISNKTRAAIQKTFANRLKEYEEEAKAINQNAELSGITIQTGIRFDQVIAEFLRPLPRWVGWIVNRKFKKHGKDPQIAYLPMIKNLNRQMYCAGIQAVFFLGFLISGFGYVATYDQNHEETEVLQELG